MKGLKIDLAELRKDQERNFAERLKFIDSWVDYIKVHSDKEWSEQQRMLIDSQIANARQSRITKEQYLEMKGERLAKRRA
ncbi:MAG: hypothetical protein HY519_01720 [Candidatus Aenigmarchaeota archaeon]|nr:hypothetical protein [Candidatus Aenigmarchaeota archaeon]